MKIKNIFYSSKFLKSIKKIPVELGSVVDERIKIFKENCFDPRLKTHKLKGRLKNNWSFSVTYEYRILFEFVNSNNVLFEEVGSHNIYL